MNEPTLQERLEQARTVRAKAFARWIKADAARLDAVDNRNKADAARAKAEAALAKAETARAKADADWFKTNDEFVRIQALVINQGESK